MIQSSSSCCQLVWSPTELASSEIGSVERAMEKPFLVGSDFFHLISNYPKSITWLGLRKSSIDFSSSFFSGLENGSILVWSPTEKMIQPSLFFDGHSQELCQILFSPNGRYLASTDYEGQLVIWSTEVKLKENVWWNGYLNVLATFLELGDDLHFITVRVSPPVHIVLGLGQLQVGHFRGIWSERGNCLVLGK